MNRLTKKFATKEGTTIGMPKAVSCYWKLKELEDIEDELGIDLIKILLFALNGGYYKENSISLPTHISKDDILVNFTFRYFNCYMSDLSLYFKDYGKTWALTKEELEK